ELVSYLARNTRRVLRLAGSAQALAGIPRQVSRRGSRDDPMSAAGSPVPSGGALELPPFSLDVQALDLGVGVRAVGLELVGTENREPVRGREAAEIWSAVFPALVAGDPYVVDFFSHIDRVREFCKARGIALREAA